MPRGTLDNILVIDGPTVYGLMVFADAFGVIEVVLQMCSVTQMMLLVRPETEIRQESDIRGAGAVCTKPGVVLVPVIISVLGLVRRSEQGTVAAEICLHCCFVIVGKPIVPVKRGHEIAPLQAVVHFIRTEIVRVVPIIALAVLRGVAATIYVQRQLVVSAEFMCDVGVEVPEGILHSEIQILPGTDQQAHRLGQHIYPAASETYVERRPVLPDGAFELEASVEKTDGEQSVIVFEVSLPCPDIDYGRKPAAVTSREAAFIEIDGFHDIGVERGEQSGQVADLIHRHSVQKIQVVGAVSSSDIHSGQKFRACGHARHLLQGLDHVGRAECGESPLESYPVYLLESCLGGVEFLCRVGRDDGFVQGVVLLLDENGVVPGLSLLVLMRQDHIFLHDLPLDPGSFKDGSEALLQGLSRRIYALRCLNVKSEGGIVDEIHTEMLMDDHHLLLQGRILVIPDNRLTPGLHPVPEASLNIPCI